MLKKLNYLTQYEMYQKINKKIKIKKVMICLKFSKKLIIPTKIAK